ncbi:PLP-dependent aminotransferase family protein [Paenibacillus antarcticus]|uniref:GntR family transcriptional regulator n=1 Tax=Paenibacillus antarcticus TaxID=253703 RepID=A0A162K3S8_9BACL|nr:PLP-dependent aminotransferase family protein [Paenibacillus antarcticus]OAB42606.1 GntR family transcriptional regulator [Paenibacillus antarcticus]
MNKYSRLILALEERIQEGEFSQGKKLPSIRNLADMYDCSKSTVIRAYEEMEKRHLIYSIPQSGYYVVQKQRESRKKLVESSQEDVLDFASSAPDKHVFPYIDFQHCINKAIDAYQDDLFTYGTLKGLPSLIQVLQKHLDGYQVFAKRDQIVVTSGVQQALAILVSMPFPNGRDTIVIEQPGYFLLIEMLKTLKVPVIGIPRNEEGIDLEKLEGIFASGKIKFFYTMPRFHNPLGTSLTMRQKQEIARLADKYDVYIVEDDYLADLESDSKADPIYTYAPSPHVIYLKSYSKILFPGLRVGVAVLPPVLIDTFSRFKVLLDIDTSTLSQAALEIYMKSGMFERHRERIKASYNKKIKQLNEALTMNSDHELFAAAPRNRCVHTVMPIPRKLPFETLRHALMKRNIIVDSTENYYLAGGYTEKTLRLNVSNVPHTSIDTGIRIIRQEIDRLNISR